MLTVEDNRLRFSHPLLASVIYRSASHERRRQLHRRLATGRHGHRAAGAPPGAQHDGAGSGDRGRARGSRPAGSAQRRATRRRRAVRRLDPAHAGRPGRGSRDVACSPRRLRCSQRETSRPPACSRRQATADAPTPRSSRRSRGGDGRDPVGRGHLRGRERAPRARPRGCARTTRPSRRASTRSSSTSTPRTIRRGRSSWRTRRSTMLDPERAPGALATVVISRMWASLVLGDAPQPELLEQWRELEERAGPEAPKSVLPLIYFHSIDDFEAARARHRGRGRVVSRAR